MSKYGGVVYELRYNYYALTYCDKTAEDI